MNEFTKEELKEIKYGICHLISEGSCDSQWNNDVKILKEKIQSMIENYCEHSLALLWDHNGRTLKCLKCEKVFN